MRGHYWSHIECRWVLCPAPEREPAGRVAAVPEQAGVPEQSVAQAAVPQQARPAAAPASPAERTTRA